MLKKIYMIKFMNEVTNRINTLHFEYNQSLIKGITFMLITELNHLENIHKMLEIHHYQNQL